MRVLFDAQGATQHSGGMRLHAVEIVTSWAEEFPSDTIKVIGGRHLDPDLTMYPNVSITHSYNESILVRAPGQLFLSAWLGYLTHPDIVISLSPIVSPLIPRQRSVCFQHDWRHIRRPEEFSPLQKAYRRLWQLSAARAGLTVCISAKAQRETLKIVPNARTVVIANGRDHARRWPTASSCHRAVTRGGPTVVTFGHHNNKRPELVIKGLRILNERLPKTWKLQILGARGDYAASLVHLSEDLMVAEHVLLPGFVTDEEYRKIVCGADCLVLASSDEGFGLPLAEAEYLGIPAVVASDSGVSELFSSAVVADPQPRSFAVALEQVLLDGMVAGVAPGEALWTWRDTVVSLRREAVALLMERRRA